ncbi:MAG: PEGA domain-containing protein, partial [Nannocystales bacterium]
MATPGQTPTVRWTTQGRTRFRDPRSEGPHFCDSFVPRRRRALVMGGVDGSQVLLDGAPQCSAPCEVCVPVGGDRQHEVRLQKEGFSALRRRIAVSPRPGG